ncbi:DUF1178 family protein [Melaminivora sp.]
MKVLDLLCAHDHAFEGWFASEDDFQGQLTRGLLQCPLCSNLDIRKALSAPRLNLRSSGQASPSPRAEAAQPDRRVAEVAELPIPAARQLQAAWLQMARQVMAQTEDVGTEFAAQARRMHYGEIEGRNIRGQATAQQAEQLLAEGIAVMPLLLPDIAKETLQ